jgi:hypothetical protein
MKLHLACLHRTPYADATKADTAAAKADASQAAAAEDEEVQEDGPSKAKKAKKGVAVGDDIFDFEVETEEAGVKVQMSVSGVISMCVSSGDAACGSRLPGCCLLLRSVHGLGVNDQSRAAALRCV